MKGPRHKELSLIQFFTACQRRNGDLGILLRLFPWCTWQPHDRWKFQALNDQPAISKGCYPQPLVWAWHLQFRSYGVLNIKRGIAKLTFTRSYFNSEDFAYSPCLSSENMSHDNGAVLPCSWHCPAHQSHQLSPCCPLYRGIAPAQFGLHIVLSPWWEDCEKFASWNKWF